MSCGSVRLLKVVPSEVYNGLLDSEGEGEGGMIWENGIVTCILSCKKKIKTKVAETIPIRQLYSRSTMHANSFSKIFILHH